MIGNKSDSSEVKPLVAMENIESTEEKVTTHSSDLENGESKKHGKHKKTSDGNVYKNPIMLLNESKKNIKYKLVSRDGPIHNPVYTFSIEMDDKCFTGQASSKKKAKTIAAIAALASFDIFVDNLDPDDAEEVEETTEVSQESETIIPKHNWYTHTISHTVDNTKEEENGHESPSKDQLKKPLQILNEIRPGLIYNCTSDVDDSKKVTFVMSVVVDEISFEGNGSSKRSAKAKVAQNVLINHFSLEHTIQSNGEPIFNISTKQSNLSKYGIERQVTLHDLYSVKYEILDETPNACKVSLCIEGTIIEGTGVNVKKAKEDATENAVTFLKEIGLYNSRLEQYKERIAARPEKTKLKRHHTSLNTKETKKMKVDEIN